MGSRNWLDLTDSHIEQSPGHYVSCGVQDFSLRYATVLSYERTSALIKERCGGVSISDQQIFHLVKRQAHKIGEQQKALINTHQGKFETIAAKKVDIYDAQSEEHIWLSDGVCVSEQKAVRDKVAKTGKERTITDVNLMQRTDGSYKTLVVAQDIDSVALAKAEICQEYGEKVNQLPIVVISDGARSIKNEVKQIFGQQVTHILDWYHLQAKVYQLMSQIAPNKKDKELSIQFILNALWKGNLNTAIDHLQNIKPKNLLKREELVGYLDKNKDYIIQYDQRRAVGKIIGSGRGEKQNDVIIAKRQKQKSMAWSPNGSRDLALVTAYFYNTAA